MRHFRLVIARTALVGALVIIGAPAFADDPAPGCTNVPNGPTVCRDGSTVSVGGKTDGTGVQEFIEYPLGKSPHSVPQDVGRGAEHLTQEIGKGVAKIFGW
jgi:hypothetical protein